MTQFSNYEKFAFLSESLRDRLDEVLDHFGVDYGSDESRYFCACPIHEGDNEQACSIFYGHQADVINWACYTHHCEDAYGKGIFNFIRGLLERRYNKPQKMGHAIQWVEKFLNFKDDGSFDDEGYKDKVDFIKMVRSLNTNNNHTETKIHRSSVLNNIEIPSQHFIDRGYSSEILRRYDVGTCKKKNKPMSGRIVVPVYDDNYEYMVGCVGRTVYPECILCNKWHSPNYACPVTPREKAIWNKWKNSPKFKAERYLYNYWFSKNHILNDGVVILVEGQGDVWRLEEAGIKHSVGLFGTSLTPDQNRILNRSGAMNLIIWADPDEAGETATEKIEKQCGNMYNIYTISSESDPGDTTHETIKNLIYPIYDKIGVKHD
jgi:5S rRNA maturation endonuclease (ribonuclease M5)